MSHPGVTRSAARPYSWDRRTDTGCPTLMALAPSSSSSELQNIAMHKTPSCRAGHRGDQTGQAKCEAKEGAGREEGAAGRAPPAAAQEGPVLPPGSPVRPAVPRAAWGTGPRVGRRGGTHTGTGTSTPGSHRSRLPSSEPSRAGAATSSVLPPDPSLAWINTSLPRLPYPGGMLWLGRGRKN